MWTAKVIALFKLLKVVWNTEIPASWVKACIQPPEPKLQPVMEPRLTMSAASPILGASGRGSTTTAQMIIGSPDMQHRYVADWAPGTAYVNGNYVKIGPRVYFCLIAGTSDTTAPATPASGDVTDNDVTWRPCLMHKRHGLILCCIDDTDPLDFDFYPGGLGPRLMPNGGTVTLTGADCPQNAVWAITGGAGAADHGYTEW